MPELPEVETLRRGLDSRTTGRTIVSADLRLPKLLREGQIEDMVGRQILSVRRFAKFLIFDLSQGLSLVLHLNLAGQIVHERADGGRFANGHPVPAYDVPLPHKSTRLILDLDDGSRIFLTDIRTFAQARLGPTDLVGRWLAAQERGPDALDGNLTAEQLQVALQRRGKTAIKTLLLDQRVLAGIGNIYADESLHGAGLHPSTAAGQIGLDQTARLLAEIQKVLEIAVRDGVAQVLNGKARPNAHLPRVHARRGEPCPDCGTVIEKYVLGNRGTYFCPTCQPPATTAER